MKNPHKMKELFDSLQPGDVVQLTGNIPDAKTRTVYSTLLRRDGPKMIFSNWHEHSECMHPDPENPITWDERKGALVSRNGYVPMWYTWDAEFSIHRGEGLKAAERYARVPRVERSTSEEDLQLVRRAMESDRIEIASSIITHHEAGSPVQQMELILKELGITATREQVIDLVATVSVASQSVVRTFDITITKNKPSSVFDVDAMAEAAMRSNHYQA